MTYDETSRSIPGRPPPASDDTAGTTRDRGRDRNRDDHPVRYEGAGIAAGFIGLVVAAAAVLVVVGQNVERVPFEFLWWEADVPLAVLLLATALVVLVLGELVGLIWRRRRRTARQLAARN